jgi:SAM-dependent methyltransferase
VYLENAPPAGRFVEDLAWERSFPVEAARRRRKEPVVSFFSKMVKRFKQTTRRDKLTALVTEFFPPGPVLDVGCGWGLSLVALAEEYTPYGVEISKGLAAGAHAAAEARGGRVMNADAVSGMRALQDGFFTGVIMQAYLEHECEPLDALRAARRLLRPGGVLIIKVPNYMTLNRMVRGDRWCGFRFPDHVNYWTPRTLLRAVTSAGLRVLRFGFLDRLPTSDNMWLVCAGGDSGGVP